MDVMGSSNRPPRREVRFDEGSRSRAKLGFVLLATEPTVEADLFRLAPAGVGVHFARVPMAGEVTVETLDAVAAGLAEAAALILPHGRLDAICYTCSSGTIVLGEERVEAELSRGAPGARATTAMTGVIRGLRALGARRIVVGTPYLDEINDLEAVYLERRGFDVLGIQGLNIRSDAEMARVAPEYLLEFVESLDRSDAEAVFLSCGALRALDIVEPLERRLGKPVVVSNQAMMWDALRLAGVEDRIGGFGRLLQLAGSDV